MQFNIKNLGIIEDANIRIDGLTVITGVNDTGKSFLSKTIYGAIKSIRSVIDRDNFKFINAMITALRPLNKLIKEEPEIAPKIQPFVSQIYNTIFESTSLDSFTSIIELNKFTIEETTKGKIDRDELFAVFDGLLKALNSYQNSDRRKELIASFDQIVVQGLFRSQINNLSSKTPFHLSLEDKEGSFANIVVDDESTTIFDINLDRFNYSDVTLIDSPVILQLSYFIRQQRVKPSNSRKNDEGIPSYYLDLLTKIASTTYNTIEGTEDIFDEIEQLIGGRFVLEESKDILSFHTNTGLDIENFNAATGIKSFGLLQMLLGSGNINRNSVLIIDEPEVHLHPKWQIHYANLIVRLSKIGIPIIVSSHSAYFLEALTVFIKEIETADISKFYFGEKNKETGKSTFRDVTLDLEPIFEKLAEPLEKLFLKH